MGNLYEDSQGQNLPAEEKSLEAEDHSPTWLEEEAKAHPSKPPAIDEVRTQLYRLDGHLIELKTLAGNQSLTIDGKHERIRTSRSGYTLQRAGYLEPRSTVVEAIAAAFNSSAAPELLVDQVADLDRPSYEVGKLPCSRPNFKNLSDDVLARLAKALNDLHADGTVGRFVQEHSDYAAQIHGGPVFLPWHRNFILRFENELRRYDSQLRLPYWSFTRHKVGDDWVDESADLEAEPWKSFFGGRANKGGQFDRWDYERETRYPASDLDSLLPRTDSVAQQLRSPSFLAFRQFEGWIGHAHSGPHAWVGGTMADPAQSPGDPLFYLLHTNIDRLWAIWQRNHPQAAQYSLEKSPAETGYEGTFIPIDDPMPGGATPRSMLDHTELGVIYFERDPELEALLPGVITIDVTRRLTVSGSLSFGKVAINDIRTRILTLANRGSLPVNVRVERRDGDFQWLQFDGRIAPCERVQLTVSFRPTATGRTSETVTVQTDAQGGNRAVEASGEGIRGEVS